MEPSVQWAGIIFVNSAGELLLNLRDESTNNLWPGVWDLIGGHVEASEAPDACILREVTEETGLTAVRVKRFRSYSVPMTNETFGLLHCYYARLDKPASELLVGEGQEHRFVAPEVLQSLKLADGIESVLSDFLAGLEYAEVRQ